MSGSKDRYDGLALHRRKFSDKDTLSVGVIMTGGTIAMTYDPHAAALKNTEPVVMDFLRSLRADDLELEFLDLMQRDSVTMEEQDHQIIADAIMDIGKRVDAILVTHGTERLASSAEFVSRQSDLPQVPIVFTGAMIPFTVAGSDAPQNVTEALFALRFLPPDVFVVFHNRVLPVPGAAKDRDRLTFVLAQREEQLERSHEQ